MKRLSLFLKPIVAALVIAMPVSAQERGLDDLFSALKDADSADAPKIVDKIWREWSKSGSPAMDLLLDRGRDALEADDNTAAIGHFSALIDHAPDFAEAYHARATAFYNEGKFGPSLDDLRMALALNPRHFGALTGLALILENLGFDAEALEAWRQVEALHPQHENVDAALQRLGAAVEGATL